MVKLKRTKDKRFWYHCTDTAHGDKVTFHPMEDGENRGGNEPTVARTCVAPKISNCLVGLPFIRDRIIFVYRTTRKIHAYHPYSVDDSKVTREKWITSPVTLIKIDEFSISDSKKEGDIYCREESGCDGSRRQIRLKRSLRGKLRTARKNGNITRKIPICDL
jgi:hypothetical protein